jgi:hypothetical protein
MIDFDSIPDEEVQRALASRLESAERAQRIADSSGLRSDRNYADERWTAYDMWRRIAKARGLEVAS